MFSFIVKLQAEQEWMDFIEAFTDVPAGVEPQRCPIHPQSMSFIESTAT
jgi:hypothetical protein